MIKSLKQDPLLKSTVVKISLLFLLLTLVLNVFHISQLDALYKEQINLTRSMVGKLVTYYPKDEANIVNVLKEGNEDLENRGKSVLNKYGYKDNSILKDNKSKVIIYKSIIVFF
ncbi:hypothetical protein [Faecalimicrobium dakarense]|uniref:hypothetical protein n=1 Tax=Faecalimicrobium dakarense TaxID=1301100 RepID=UPI0004B22FFE|nr:hypothetical protein [[Clostridium] dakarense]